MVAIERGDVDVFAAVVIVVRNSHTHAVHFHVQAASLGHIAERAVVVVMVERGHGAAATGSKILAVDQQNIRPAVSVGIEERAAGAEGFGKILMSGASG